MHEYDVTLKSVLSHLKGSVLATLTGFAIERWHSVDVPEVRALRADLIGETAEGVLVHIELQSTNDGDMALRMAEYAFAIYRRFRRFPEQIVLYVGETPLRMESALNGDSVSFRCRMVDIRDLDGEPLLASELLEDNIVAVLMHCGNQRDGVRRILQRIAASEPAKRGVALRELAILAGLRSLGTVVREETTKMPILNDIMDHDLFGPAIRRGMEMGREEGRTEGREEGRTEGYHRGEQAIIGRQIEKRFGVIPTWVQERLESMSAPDMERIALRLLDAQSLEELLS